MTILITGSSSGFGLSLTQAALLAGHHVIATSRDLDPLQILQAQFPDHCRLHPLDVTHPQLDSQLREILQTSPPLDVLINNGGSGLLCPLETTPLPDIRSIMETHFIGPMRLMQAVIPHFRQQQRGHIINISAAAAISNYPGFSAYGAAKAALEYASEAAAAELSPHHINVTLIQPGPFRTRFITKSRHPDTEMDPAYANTVGRFQKVLQHMDGKQVGNPDKAADYILQLIDNPPTTLRVPLGKYAIRKAETKAQESLKQLQTLPPQSLEF